MTFADGVIYEGDFYYNEIIGKVKQFKIGKIHLEKWFNLRW